MEILGRHKGNMETVTIRFDIGLLMFCLGILKKSLFSNSKMEHSYRNRMNKGIANICWSKINEKYKNTSLYLKHMAERRTEIKAKWSSELLARQDNYNLCLPSTTEIYFKTLL